MRLAGAAQRDQRRTQRDHLLGDAQLDLLAADVGHVLLVLGRGQTRLDEPERHRVDVDLELAPFLGQRPGQPDHGRLARGVVGLAGVAHRARDRGDVDDLAEHLDALLALLLGRLAHVGGDRPAHPERDDRVDVDHLLKPLVAHLVDRRVERVAGVVDQDVDLAPLVDHLLDELVGDALLGQVSREHQRLAGDLRRGLLGDVAVDVVDQDLRALLGEQLGGGASDPAGRAGDDRHLVVENCHVGLPISVFTRLAIMPVRRSD